MIPNDDFRSKGLPLPSFQRRKLRCVSAPSCHEASESFEEEEWSPIQETPSKSTDSQRRKGLPALPWKSFLLFSFFAVSVFAIISANLQDRFRNTPGLTERTKIEALILERYGRGPYLIEFELNVWNSNNKYERRFFTVESAPVSLMPNTVHAFLEQVSARQWDGTSIPLNANHVIAASPVSGDGRDAKAITIPRPEYNPNYPHLPYTLGFSDSSFYINKRNNRQQEHESCFARVVIGRSTVDAIAAQTTDSAGRIRPIDIVHVKRVLLTELSAKATREYLANKVPATHGLL